MLEKLNSCPLCKNHDSGTFLEGIDFFLTHEPFLIEQCKTCGFRFTNPRPDFSSIQRYYQSQEYLSHDSDQSGLISMLYNLSRKFTIRTKYRIIKKYSQGKKILDIGSGTGEFLNFCKQRGWECHGIEPSEKAREFATRKYCLKVEPNLMTSESITGNFDSITMWHSLEHIHELNRTIEKIKHLLKEDGILVLALPSCNSFDAAYYKEFWAAYDLPRHIYHFTRNSVSLLATNFGLTCIKTIPQNLDAFYISLLSEKYRNSSAGLIRAFLTGLRSNIKARHREYEYSSMIYLLKKKIS